MSGLWRELPSRPAIEGFRVPRTKLNNPTKPDPNIHTAAGIGTADTD